MAELLKLLPASCKKDFQSVDEVFAPENLMDSKVTEWKGRIFGRNFDAETSKFAFDHHEPLENDVLIASFKKTGTTWTREIVRQILYGRDEKLDRFTKELSFPIIYLETGLPKKFNIVHNLPLPRRYYVTHLPYELLNMKKYKERNMKIIYTIRNPKDQLVSFYHHMKNFSSVGVFEQFKIDTWDEAFKQEMEGSYPHLLRKGETYVDHILNWLPHIREEENIMMITYEEMVKEPLDHVKKIANFLDVELSEQVMKDIAINCSLDNMMKAASSSSAQDSIFLKNYGLLRKGKVGNWKEYFTVAQSEMMDKKIEDKLGGTGIKFIYE